MYLIDSNVRKNTSKLTDPYHRKINYLRVSITDRCNLKCIYCNPQGTKPKLHHNDILRYEEILRIINIMVSQGVSKIRITGGEPFVRKGVFGFLSKLSKINGIDDLSVTTNGLMLPQIIDQLKQTGIKRINISLDTLIPQRYHQIMGINGFSKVWQGIQLALAHGFDPIKVNTVALRGINDQELIDLAQLTQKYPFHVRFIEYMPLGDQEINKKQQILLPEIIEKLKPLGKLIPLNGHTIYDGPAKRYKLEGAQGEIGFINPMSHHFCHKCNRLRLTANGQLRACLFSTKFTNLKEQLRSGASDDELVALILKAVNHKPQGLLKGDAKPNTSKIDMVSIGG